MILRSGPNPFSNRYSAIAFHNGTMVYVAYRPGSTEYQALMQSILNKEFGRSPQRRSTRCLRAEPPPPPSPFDESFLSFLVALFSLPKELWNKHAQQPVVQEPPVPVSPNAQLFKTQMEALPPFANMSAEQRLHVSVSISVPAWLTGTEEACQVIEAAVMTFGRVAKPESPPSASYTALGYELCRISYDAFDCTGPGRIMTIEFQSDLIVMSLARTPLLEWSFDPLTFSVSGEHDGDALVEWIDSFVDTQNPDMVMMSGPNADVPHLRNAVLRSRAASHLIDQPSIPGHRAVAMGAARAAKDRLESQIDDCSEPKECIEIRKQADRIAGKYKVPKPSIWPAVGRLHLHQEL
jgi:hypothetical protein